jgi:inosine-uridine nucleoside N-ribohydrolase
MTNLAQALRAEPSLAGRIRRVIAMVGAIDVPGNAPEAPAAETNAWIDPTAMRSVLRSYVPFTLVLLDATNQVPVTPYLGDALRRHSHATRAATAAWELVRATRMADGGSYFWDPLAAGLFRDPTLATTSTRRIDASASGRTAARAAGVPVAVATRSHACDSSGPAPGSARWRALLDPGSSILGGRSRGPAAPAGTPAAPPGERNACSSRP